MDEEKPQPLDYAPPKGGVRKHFVPFLIFLGVLLALALIFNSGAAAGARLLVTLLLAAAILVGIIFGAFWMIRGAVESGVRRANEKRRDD